MSEQWVCEHCGRRLRPFKAKAADYPGAFRPRTMTCCQTCAVRMKEGIPLPGRDYECSRCHKAVSTELPKPKGVPGPAPGGVCLPCSSALAGGAPAVRDTHCVDCGRYMVTNRAGKREIPGSVYRYDASKCRICFDRAKRPVHVDEPDLPRLDPEEALAMYLRGRRARLARKARADAAILAEQTRAYALHRAS